MDLVESEDGSIIRLRDANGVFLEVAPGDSDGGDASVVASDGVEDGTEDPEVGRTVPETEAGKGVEIHRRERVARVTRTPISQRP